MASMVNNYARAMAEVIVGNKLDAAAVLNELDSVATALDGSPDLHQLWATPAIPVAQKLNVLDSLAPRMGLSKPVRNFIAVLIDKRRIGSLRAVLEQLKTDLNERLGLAEATVTSARELDADEKRALEAQIAKATGKKIRARYGQDKSLLGGAVVKVGSTIYDGSVRGRLARLKQQIAAE